MYVGIHEDVEPSFDTASPSEIVVHKNLRNPLFLWIMRLPVSAYTRRTKLLARKENESRYPPELPGNHRDMQLRQQLQDQVRDGQASPARRSLFRVPPCLLYTSDAADDLL